jgi:hypothetical protein
MSIVSKLREGVESSPLGSTVFADPAMIDATVEHLLQVLRDAQADAVRAMAWQYPSHFDGAETVREHLLRQADEIRSGTIWDERG